MRLALIDADILVYRIGFASEDSSEAIVKSRMREFVEDLILFNGFDSFEGFISGSSNYTKDIAVTATYKGNRKQPKPKHYNFLREYLLSDWEFKLIEDQEADDAIGIRAYEMDIVS